MEDAGWLTVTPARSGFTTGGPTATTVCRGAAFATFSSPVKIGDDRLIRVVAGPNTQRSCAAAGGSRFGDVPIPALQLPPGARTMGGGGSGGADDFESRARLQTTLGIAALAAVLLPQMTAAGWTVAGPTAGDAAVSITRLTATSKAGDPVTALLLLTALGDTDSVDAVLRVVRNKPIIHGPGLGHP